MSTIIYHKHHLIPKYIGGTNDASNILRCNLALHAFLHKLLFEENGHWQDELAWKGLAGMIGKDEIIQRIKTETWKGKKHSSQTKRKISLSNMGCNHPMFGKKQPKEFVRKRAKSCSREWNVVHPNGLKEIIKNMADFCRKHGLNRGNMSSVSSGKLKHHKGFHCSCI
jgi:hypothetical protein